MGIVPASFGCAMGSSKGAVKDFFWEGVEGSELPVMIYNFP